MSLFVISIGFLGVVNLSTSTLRNSFLQRDSIVASMLVQEGIELVYNIRDTNLAKGDPAFSNILGSATGLPYRASFESPTLVSVLLSVPPLSMDGQGFYGYSGTTQTKFSRKIIVKDTSFGGAQSREITSVVIWGGTTFPSLIDESHCGKSLPNPSGQPIHCAFARAELQEN